MFMELSVQEQKYQAVLAVLSDGRSVSEVAEQWGVSRQSLHAWLRRYEDFGLAGPNRRTNTQVSALRGLVARATPDSSHGLEPVDERRDGGFHTSTERRPSR